MKNTLQAAVEKWGQNVTKSSMSKAEALTATNQTIGRSLRYPLAATAMNRGECKDIQIPLCKYSLGKLGVVRTAPMTIATGPVRFGGLGLAHMYENQMIDHIHVMMQHGHLQTVTGKLLRISLENLALESGMSGDPVAIDVMNSRWITQRTWIGITLQAMREYGINMQSTVMGLQSWVSNDDMIMDGIEEFCQGADLHRFNKVRMYLRVNTLSDLLTADLTKIDRTVLGGERAKDLPHPSAHYKWAHVPIPTKTERRVWKATICKKYKVTPNQRVVEGWYNRIWKTEAHPVCAWLVSPNASTILQKYQNGWKMWNKSTPTNGRTRSQRVQYIATARSTESITNYRPCSVDRTSVGTIKIRDVGPARQDAATTNT